MFKTIARLLFGGEEKTPEDVKSADVVEEGWLVVSHQEAENQHAELTDVQPSNSALHSDTAENMETDKSVLDPEPAAQSSSSSSSSNNNNSASQAIAGYISQPKALAEVTQLICIQKAKGWTYRHNFTRNAIQRQNRIRQGVQHHSFHLQQPGLRNLSH